MIDLDDLGQRLYTVTAERDELRGQLESAEAERDDLKARLEDMDKAKAVTTTGADGTTRKAYYGDGEQPWDTMRRVGWAPEFAAGSILKYLRRAKDVEHSVESARIYFRWLVDLSKDDTSPWIATSQIVLRDLLVILSHVELDAVGAIDRGD